MAQGQLITLGSILQSKANQIIAVMRKNLEKSEAVASGRLLASIRPEIKIFGDTYVMEIKMEDYWKEIDEGRKAGLPPPPVEDIVKWMRRKGIGITPDRRIRSGRKMKSISVSVQRYAIARRIARAISLKGTIKRFGYKGTNFFSDVINPSWIETLKADIGAVLKKNYTIQIIQAAS